MVDPIRFGNRPAVSSRDSRMVGMSDVGHGRTIATPVGTTGDLPLYPQQWTSVVDSRLLSLRAKGRNRYRDSPLRGVSSGWRCDCGEHR